jgi:uncharacterized protein YdaU (DUF1376 family)
MAKPDLWMPFYVGDYLRDTMHLSIREHGAYLMLLFAYWIRGGPLPGDSESLAAICHVTSEEFQRTLNARCRPFFQISDDGCWHHKRVDLELARANRNIEQKRQAGRASANARTNARLTDVPTDVPTAHPTARQRNRIPSPSPSPSHTPSHPAVAPVVGGVGGRNGTFVPPTPKDVSAFMEICEAEKFCDFYESKGWLVGKVKMKSWQAAARNWARRNGVSEPQAPLYKTGPLDAAELAAFENQETLAQVAQRLKASDTRKE